MLKETSYHIPSGKECTTCHASNRKIIPIGFKLNNLNRNVVRNGNQLNQLNYFKTIGLMMYDTSSFSSLPDWKDTSVPLAQRARAYLDINCAHCHTDYGYCANSKLRLNYSASMFKSTIESKASRIDKMMTKKRMPLLGTTVVHEEGLALIKDYIESLD